MSEFSTESPCKMCGEPASDCTCPECPVCHETGNPQCYETTRGGHPNHGMQASKKQLIVQSRMQIAKLKGDIYWEEQYLEYLTKGDLL